MKDGADELGRALLAELLREPGLTRPRRLARGAVLAGGHVDLTGVGPAVWTVLRGLDAAAEVRGVWLADNAFGANGAALAELLARHARLEHVELAGNGLAGSVTAVVAKLAGLRSLGLADNAIDGGAMARLARMLEGTGVRHVGLGRGANEETGEVANVLDAAAVDAWAGAIGRDPGWTSLDLRGIVIADEDAERLLAAVERGARMGRFLWDRPLSADLRARLAHASNRQGMTAPPDRARLWRAVPREIVVAPLPAEWSEIADELAAASRLLERLAERPALLADPHPHVAALRRGLARALREERREERRVAREARAAAERRRRREEDQRRIEEAAIRQRRGGTAPSPGGRDPGETTHTLNVPRPCYVCKDIYTRLHFFYDRLCPTCATESYRRRVESIDLRGCFAVVTGGRIKIGHEAALRLLRWGAQVLVTSRFPRDTVRRFAEYPDFNHFAERLQVHGLDLRVVPDVEVFARHVVTSYPRVDILINNAAQTVRRSPAFFAALAAGEARALPAGLAPRVTERTAPVADEGPLPALLRDEFGDPADDRAENSWRLKLGEVGTLELLEVQVVNVVAPFLLNAKLRPVMARRRAEDAAYIINVSAPEGRFDRFYKSPYHPHTNMAKAALNMMTRTSAEEYAADGIYMTSVDPGWASNENPEPVAAAMRARGFMPPLDLVDAAARVCDPVVRGRRDGVYLSGVFLKDFMEVSW